MLKYLPDVKDIATNDKDWTILNFKDGEKVIVKCSQAYDLEKGILYAYAKKHRRVKPELKSPWLDAEIQKTQNEIALTVDWWCDFQRKLQQQSRHRRLSEWDDLQRNLQQQYGREPSHNQKRLDKIIWELHRRKRKRQLETT